MNSKIKVFAYYLPQYHPIKENDDWWGDGFTEWTNVALSRPLFEGHYQPQIPGKLGFYDLRLHQTVIDQALLAKEHGVTAFCYWHYWLGNGVKLLNKPAENLIANPNPDFPFFFAWANHSWKGVFFGAEKQTLVEQTYGDKEEIKDHFNYLLQFFSDKRYYKINGKPILQIYNPKGIPDCKGHLKYLNELAIASGFDGLYFIGENIECENRDDYGLDAVTYSRHRAIEYKGTNNTYLRKIRKLKNILFKDLKLYEYKEASKYFLKRNPMPNEEYPSIVPNWDTTPRLKNKATILHNSTPEFFKESCDEIFQAISDKPEKHQIVFLKSWNEWAEGNYIEPDRKWGKKYLEALKDSLNKYNF